MGGPYLVQVQLNLVEGLLSSRGLMINPKKPQAIKFSWRRQPLPRKIFLYQLELKDQIPEFKFELN